ncbi:MAG: YciI-like protein [Steroidobacteraceae bacterium]
MKHYLLFYSFIDRYLERRPAFRDAHLAHAWQACGRGGLRLAGALADPADAGILWFEGESPEVAAAFARNDPYVINGLVTSWKVREWTTVVGTYATTPMHPPPEPAGGPR